MIDREIPSSREVSRDKKEALRQQALATLLSERAVPAESVPLGIDADGNPEYGKAIELPSTMIDPQGALGRMGVDSMAVCHFPTVHQESPDGYQFSVGTITIGVGYRDVSDKIFTIFEDGEPSVMVETENVMPISFDIVSDRLVTDIMQHDDFTRTVFTAADEPIDQQQALELSNLLTALSKELGLQ